MTSAALLSSALSDSLRPFSVSDKRLRPSKVGPSCGAIRSMVSDNVSRDWVSEPVSVPAVFVVKSLTASVNEYGDDVRDTGMTSDGVQRVRCLLVPGSASVRRGPFPS